MRWLPLALALLAAPAHAQGSHPSVQCVLSATPLNFGAYTPRLSQPSEFTATLTITCSTPLATPVAVSGRIGLGGGGGGLSTRRMANEGQPLRYQLFADAAHTMPWGDGTAGSATIALQGTVRSGLPLRRSYIVYGRLLARQTGTRVGTYADILAVTFNY